MILTIAAAVLALAAAPDPGPMPQDPPSQSTGQDEPTRLDDVVVRGTLEEQVEAFVGEIAADAAPEGRFLASWHDRICPGVVNLDNAWGQAVLDRITLVAGEMDVQTGAPGCDPNVVIIFTNDGAGLASAMVAREPNVFEHPNLGMFNRGSSDLAWFTGSDAPVRWWHLSMPVDATTHQRTVILGSDIKQVEAGGAEGRLTVNTVDVLYKVIIVVDVERLNGVALPQLADYLAMVTLAQIDPQAEVGDFNTVLNVFNRPSIAGLTDWDRSYLAGLYTSASRRRDPNSRNDDVASRMVRDQRAPAQPGDEE